MEPPQTASGTNRPSTIQVLIRMAASAQPTSAAIALRAARRRLARLGGD
jgi:hypothetical protein